MPPKYQGSHGSLGPRRSPAEGMNFRVYAEANGSRFGAARSTWGLRLPGRPRRRGCPGRFPPGAPGGQSARSRRRRGGRAPRLWPPRCNPPGCLGLEKGLNIPVLAVADDKEPVPAGQRGQHLLLPGEENAAVFSHIAVFLRQDLIQDGLHLLLIQLGHQAVEDVGQQHAHAGLEPLPGDSAGILGRQALQRLIPGDADGVHAVPQRSVQIKQQSVKQGRFLPS